MIVAFVDGVRIVTGEYQIGLAPICKRVERPFYQPSDGKVEVREPIGSAPEKEGDIWLQQEVYLNDEDDD